MTVCNSFTAFAAPTTLTVSSNTIVASTMHPVSVRNSSPPPPNSGNATGFNVDGLLSINSYAVSCALGVGGYRNAVVLASNRLEYDDGEIHQMATYLGQSIRANPFDASNLPTPPSTLNETLASLTGTDPSQSTCFSFLQITNIATSTLQITGVDIRLQSNAQPNQYQYRLIDACSLAAPNAVSGNNSLCPKLGSGGQLFEYDFNLNMANANTAFSGQLQGSQSFTIDPSQVAYIYLNYVSAANLIYSVAPEITVSQTNAQTTLPLSQLTSTLAFVNPDQLSCYQLQGNTFTQIPLNTSGGKLFIMQMSRSLCCYILDAATSSYANKPSITIIVRFSELSIITFILVRPYLINTSSSQWGNFTTHTSTRKGRG